jgi:putative ABC transport system permease protein
MLRNYFKTAWRSLKMYRAYSLIHVLGLTVGITACLIIFLVVRYELGYDHFNRQASRIYRVTLNALDFNSNISMAVVPALRNDFRELEQVTQVYYQREGQVQIRDNRFIEKGFAYADESFPRIFDFQVISGNIDQALAEPNSAVLTESLAKKYFGKGPAMGQVFRLDNQFTLRVNAVIKDPPGNTSLPFLFLVSFRTQPWNEGMFRNFYWINGGSYAYTLLPKTMKIADLEKRIPAFIEKNWGKEIAKEAHLPLQPLGDIHFDQRYINNIITPSSRSTYWALVVIGVFIIFMASINFINLSTAQAIRRSREVGVRKVLGARLGQLVLQFLGETGILVLLSGILGLIVTTLCLPLMADWLDIRITMGQLLRPAPLGAMAGIAVLVILLAGLYPAFVQSSFLPAESLRQKTGPSFHTLSLRKGLVLIQFTISQVLVVGTLVVARQMDFFKNQDLGFSKEAVVNFLVPDISKKEVLRQQLAATAGVGEISFSSGAPSMNGQATGFNAPNLGMTETDVSQVIFVDEKYADMFGLKMLAGRPIQRQSENDSLTQQLVVNETLIHRLGIQDPRDAIGKRISEGLITGVIQDFQNESKHKKRRACMLFYNPKQFYQASVRIEPGSIHKTLGQIDKSWSALFPEQVFEYQFLDDHIASMYREEEKEYTAFKMFSCIAILSVAWVSTVWSPWLQRSAFGKWEFAKYWAHPRRILFFCLAGSSSS